MEISPGYIIKNRFENVIATNILVTVKAVNITTNAGQVPIYQGSILYEDKFAGGLDGVCVKVDTFNNTLEETAVTSGGSAIAVVSIDGNGNYQLSGTPASPSAIRYLLLTTIEGLQYIPISVRESLRFVENTGGGGISYVYMNRPPELTDDTYTRGTRWIDIVDLNEYLLTNIPVSGDAIWKKTTTVDENGNIIIEGNIKIEGSLDFGEAIAVSLNANIVNFIVPDIEKAYLVHIEPSGNYSIDGIVAPTPLKNMKIEVFNTGIGNLTLKNNSGAADPNNRFILGANKAIQIDEGIGLVYDTLDNKWRSTSINI